MRQDPSNNQFIPTLVLINYVHYNRNINLHLTVNDLPLSITVLSSDHIYVQINAHFSIIIRERYQVFSLLDPHILVQWVSFGFLNSLSHYKTKVTVLIDIQMVQIVIFSIKQLI